MTHFRKIYDYSDVKKGTEDSAIPQYLFIRILLIRVSSFVIYCLFVNSFFS